jgi:hypothetical protein
VFIIEEFIYQTNSTLLFMVLTCLTKSQKEPSCQLSIILSIWGGSARLRVGLGAEGGFRVRVLSIAMSPLITVVGIDAYIALAIYVVLATVTILQTRKTGRDILKQTHPENYCKNL